MIFKIANSSNKLLKIGLLVLVAAGLIISTYLLYQHYLIINEANGKADVCYAVFGKGCTRALASSVAVQLGLPLAGWGVIFYFVLIALLVLPVIIKINKTAISIVVCAITLLGCIGSVLLLVMIYFDRSLFCPFCIIIHGINILLFLCCTIIVFTSNSFTGFRKHINSLFNSLKKRKRVTIKWAAGFIVLIVFMYCIMQIILMPGKIIFDAQKFIANFENTLQQTIIVDNEDAVSGPANALVQLTIFSDFECPACRNFSKIIAALHKKYHNKLYIVFKNFPLGKECNPIYGDYDLHPKACEAARAAEAAKLQHKFWPYHDLLFSLDIKKTKETFSSIATKVDLNQEKFEKDRKSKKVMTTLSKTIEQGKQLGVRGTPTVFLNGRMVSDFRLLHMQVLLDYLLNSSKVKINGE